jgi:hypothetical protein
MAGKFDLEHKVRDRELLCRVRIENEAALVMPDLNSQIQPCSKSLPRVKIW